jgi:sensor histidine kinase YesM
MLFSLLVSQGKSQTIPESVHYLTFSVEDGLPSAETYDVFADSKGFIWIGTDRGLVRFDGNDFEIFTTEDGLTDNTVFRCWEDAKNRIWFTTLNRRLFYYQEGQFHPYKYNDTLIKLLTPFPLSSTIANLNIGPDDALHIDILYLMQVNISPDGKGSLDSSVYYHAGIEAFIEKKTEVERLQAVEKILKTHFEAKRKLIGQPFKRYNYSYYLEKDQLVQLGENGAIFYNIPGQKIERHILKDHFITGMTVDFESGYWFSTLNEGIIYVPKMELSFYPLQHKNYNPILLSILPQEQQLLFAYSDGKTYLLNDTTKQLEPFEGPLLFKSIPPEVRKSGIKFENTKSIIPFHGPVKALLELDSTHLLYSNSNRGAQQLRQTIAGRWEKRFINGPKLNKIVKDNEGRVWGASIEGLHYLNKQLDSFLLYEKHPLPATSGFQDILILEDSSMIFATEVYGLLVKKGKNYTTVTTENGLISNNTNHLAFDKKNQLLWVATTKGINSLKWEEGKLSQPVHTIGATYELGSTDIRLLQLVDNQLIFASNKGISSISLAELNSTNTAPKLYLEGLQMDNEEVPLSLSKNLEFSHEQNNLAIQLRGISYHSQLRYLFQLSEKDSSWKVASGPTLNLFSLAPGDYLLKVKAVNEVGIKSKSITIPFNIAPPFWLEAWFLILVLLLLLLLLFISVKKITARYQSRVQLQIDLLKFKSMNLQSKMNPHFIFNSLNSIQHYIITNKKKEANDFLVDFSKLTRRILNNSNSIEISLEEELQTLELYVKLEQERLRHNFQFSIELSSDIQQKNCLIPTLLLQPFIENAIWHGNSGNISGGKIVLRVTMKQAFLYFEIEDNGPGYNNTLAYKKKDRKSYGTIISKKRLDLLRSLHPRLSEIRIGNARSLNCSDGNLGTLVEFDLPYKLKEK